MPRSKSGRGGDARQVAGGRKIRALREREEMRGRERWACSFARILVSCSNEWGICATADA